MRREVTEAITSALARLEALVEEVRKKAGENHCLQPTEMVALQRKIRVETGLIRDEVEKARGHRDRKSAGAAK